MVKILKLICIAGILALLFLFVIFTGSGHPANKNTLDQRTFKEQSINQHKTINNHCKPEAGINTENNGFKTIILW